MPNNRGKEKGSLYDEGRTTLAVGKITRDRINELASKAKLPAHRYLKNIIAKEEAKC